MKTDVIEEWDRSEVADALGITKRRLRNLLYRDAVPSRTSFTSLKRVLSQTLLRRE